MRLKEEVVREFQACGFIAANKGKYTKYRELLIELNRYEERTELNQLSTKKGKHLLGPANMENILSLTRNSFNGMGAGIWSLF